MKFLIQTDNNKITHDFSRELIEACKYLKWVDNSFEVNYEFMDWRVGVEFDDRRSGLIPIGSVEFVSAYIKQFHKINVKPWNIPESLLDLDFTRRNVINGTEKDIDGYKFVKSNDKIKGYTELKDFCIHDLPPKGNYQISDVINIDSEYRCFIYKGELVGLKHYAGDFTIFPHMHMIYAMIKYFKDAPVAYTLDIGVNNEFPPKPETFIIEVHDFFSCGLYGFNDYRILPYMFQRWFNEFLNKKNG